jgi:outer membrane protein TolC
MSLSLLFFILLLPQSPMPPPNPGDERPIFGGVPVGPATGEVLELTLVDAIDRGLQRNLALLLGEQRIRAARGARWEALSEVLPNVSFKLSETRQKLNLEAFGFTSIAGFPNIPPLVGPFDVFDARAQFTETLFALDSFEKVRAEEARIDAARALLDTARALLELAQDRKKAGLVPSVDVLRADVERARREQDTIIAEVRFAKAKLALARAIGLPLGQQFHLADRVPYSPARIRPLEEALQTAYANRSDWKAAEARLRAAERARRSATGEWLPSLDLWGDYGALGATAAGARTTYALGAAIRVPLFNGGKTIGKRLEAEAALESERAALEDLRSRVRYEVESASLDLKAAEDRVAVAERAMLLAKEELSQAQDRFRAGVANNIDVVQAQQSVAGATESYIASLYDHNVAKATMGRALGIAASSYKQVLQGER